jgi:hypothetical protein
MIRPLFELKLRDMDQLLDIRFLAEQDEVPVNEWILRQIERVPLLHGARLTAKKELEGNNAEIATGGSAGVAAAGISPEGKRGVQKGVAGDHGELLRGQSSAAFNERSRPENPIETDAVGTTGCKVTVSRAMAGRPAHAGNCTCFTCKPPKGA